MLSLGLKNTLRSRKSRWRETLGPQASASILSPNYTDLAEQPQKEEPGLFLGTLHLKSRTFGSVSPAWRVL